MNGQPRDDFTEDATGFGRAELRTLRDTLLRPREVLEAYMTGGPDGGGRYARPLRLYLTLCGFMMLVLFLRGGAGGAFAELPPQTLEQLLDLSGKSLDAFLADADSWMSLTLVPVLCAFYALATAPLLRWWDPENLGWGRGFRASFAYLNAVTIPVLPFTWFAYDPATAGWTTLLIAISLGVMFIRMGAGRWYASLFAAMAKVLIVVASIFLIGFVGSGVVTALAMAGAVFGP